MDCIYSHNNGFHGSFITTSLNSELTASVLNNISAQNARRGINFRTNNNSILDLDYKNNTTNNNTLDGMEINFFDSSRVSARIYENISLNNGDGVASGSFGGRRLAWLEVVGGATGWLVGRLGQRDGPARRR